MLRDTQLKSVYTTETDNILTDFYNVALKECIKFDRAVGFFSAANISYAAQGISRLIQNGGKIRLVVGAFVNQDDFDAVQEGYNQRPTTDLECSLLTALAQFEEVDDVLFQNRLKTLAWLIAHHYTDIKIAIRKIGMYHEKIGIMEDATGDKLIFTGSSNETPYGMLKGYNFESINVFKSWEDKPDHWKPHLDTFDRLWSNKAKDTIVLDAPNELVRRFTHIAESSRQPTPGTENRIWQLYHADNASNLPNLPAIPQLYKGSEFALRGHQEACLHEWSRANFRGIFELATGAGKTITAITAIAKLFKANAKLAAVISVPYQNLADQWCEELREFNITPIRCYTSHTSWKDKLDGAIQHYRSGVRNFLCAVVVNRTLSLDLFQEFLQAIPGDSLLFVGDECHHHGGQKQLHTLPQHARFRIGLSATPHHWINDDRNEILHRYYGEIIASYTLKDAISNNVLTPYYYHPILTPLTNNEAEQYIDISRKISKLIAQKQSSASLDEGPLGSLLSKRARILGSAQNKATILDTLLKGLPVQKHTLFYAGEGLADQGEEPESELRQIELLSQIIAGNGWHFSRFTSAEDRKTREAILAHFKIGDVDALISMRCLDEGVDIPSCRTAFILASSRDPRQFVQRRGRILRKSPGKSYATIYDFIVHLPDGCSNDACANLMRNELSRVSEFANLSLNRFQTYNTLKDLLSRYNILDAI